jgi:hypothetical protein
MDDYNECTWINMMKNKFKPLSNFKIFKEIIDKEFGGESKVFKMIMVANSNFKLAIINSTIVDSNTIFSKMKFLKRSIKLFLQDYMVFGTQVPQILWIEIVSTTWSTS